MNDADRRELDITRIILELVHKAWIIILAGVITASIVCLYTIKFITPIYTADALLYINNFSEDVQSQVVRVSDTDINTSQALVGTYIAFLSSDQVLEGVVEELNGRYTTEMIKSMMKASSVNETELFRISVSHPNPGEAEKIANIVTDKSIEVVSNYLEGSSIKVVDYAAVPQEKSYPSTSKNTLLGFLVGACIASLIIILLMLFNEKVSGDKDLEAMFDEPVIGRVPDFNQIYGEGYHYRYGCGYNGVPKNQQICNTSEKGGES